MESSQFDFIKYAADYAENTQTHIWLGGSFLNGGYTTFSDIDITVRCNNAKAIKSFIYGYNKPIYISHTTNPLGILIVIYENGAALDLEIAEESDIKDDTCFHKADIKSLNYTRNIDIYKQITKEDNLPHQMSRLFHRSLIKYLSGKEEIGINIANEIADFINLSHLSTQKDYKNEVLILLKCYNHNYHLPDEYYNLLCKLIDQVK